MSSLQAAAAAAVSAAADLRAAAHAANASAHALMIEATAVAEAERVPPSLVAQVAALRANVTTLSAAARAAGAVAVTAESRASEAAARRSRRLDALWHGEASEPLAAAFAQLDPENAAAARAWLTAAAARGEVEPFHASYFPAAYVGRLPLYAWLRGEPLQPAPVRHASRFEPYFIFRPPAPRFDEAYRGRGFNKSGYWAALGLAGEVLQRVGA